MNAGSGATFALAALILLGACGIPRAQEGGSGGETGLEGVVVRGPICPGPQRRDRPCPDQPFEGTFVLRDAEGQEVGRFQTDSAGRFRVPLPPGEYRILPDASTRAQFPTRREQPATVRSGGWTQVTLRFDTGIR